jgi:hypothetical protein
MGRPQPRHARRHRRPSGPSRPRVWLPILAVAALAVSGPVVTSRWWTPYRTRPLTTTSAISAETRDASSTTAPATSAPLGPGDPGAIARENALPGDPSWTPVADPAAWARIQGYADRASAQRGDTVRLFVSTASATTFHVEVYRMGWYGGAGARLHWRSAEQAGVTQPKAVVDRVTRMAEAPWQESLGFTVGPDWVTGVYMAKLVSSNGGQSLVPLIVRDDASRAPLLVQSSVTAWQASNAWGGASLDAGGAKADPALRATVVSFDRPYSDLGAGEYFGRQDMLVQQVESMGLDVAYTTDVDTHQHPSLLQNHIAFVSDGHDEYWTKEVRDGVEAARDRGVNLLFTGAKTGLRRVRLEPSPLGLDRHEVNYRVAGNDPLNRVDNEHVTTNWRDAPAPRAESSLVGALYECNPVKADMVITAPSSWVFAGTGWQQGDTVPGAIGSAYDRVALEFATPDNIEVLTHSPLRCKGVKSFADMTYYTASSGAGVLATGTSGWEPLLGPLCPDERLTTDVACRVRRATANVLGVFAAVPAGLVHPSQSNLDALGIKRGYVKPVPPP